MTKPGTSVCKKAHLSADAAFACWILYRIHPGKALAGSRQRDLHPAICIRCAACMTERISVRAADAHARMTKQPHTVTP